jgi:GDP-4-dehydro-6-deoxy-D-mannose reductase
MSPPVLITGAAGFAGSHLVDLLAAQHDAEIVAWRRPGATPPRQGPPLPEAPVPGTVSPRAEATTCNAGTPAASGRADRSRFGRSTRIRWEAVDVLDRDAVYAAIASARPHAVYHCAGAAHVGRAWTSTEPAFAINVRGTHHLIEALKRAGLADARVLIPSSALVYAAADDTPISEEAPLRPSSPYGLSKLAQEMLGTDNPDGPRVLIARPFNHFGPRQDPFFAASGFARAIAQIEKARWEPTIQVGNLDARRDLTDVRDTVRAYESIVEHGVPGRPYNVCTGTAIAIRELLDLFLARARARIDVRVDPARYRPNDLPVLVGDPSRIRDELGWSPQIPVEQTVDDLLEYWRSQ